MASRLGFCGSTGTLGLDWDPQCSTGTGVGTRTLKPQPVPGLGPPVLYWFWGWHQDPQNPTSISTRAPNPNQCCGWYPKCSTGIRTGTPSALLVSGLRPQCITSTGTPSAILRPGTPKRNHYWDWDPQRCTGTGIGTSTRTPKAQLVPGLGPSKPNQYCGWDPQCSTGIRAETPMHYKCWDLQCSTGTGTRQLKTQPVPGLGAPVPAPRCPLTPCPPRPGPEPRVHRGRHQVRL